MKPWPENSQIPTPKSFCQRTHISITSAVCLPSYLILYWSSSGLKTAGAMPCPMQPSAGGTEGARRAKDNARSSPIYTGENKGVSFSFNKVMHVFLLYSNIH